MVLALMAWWQSARGSKDVPDRANLDPAAIQVLLPFVIIAETGNPFRIRFRLVGTGVVNYVGFDFTGGYLDELWPSENIEPWLEHYRAARETRSPRLGAATDRLMSGGSFTYEFGIFPLTNGGDAVTQFISVEDYAGYQFMSAEWLERRRHAFQGSSYLFS